MYIKLITGLSYMVDMFVQRELRDARFVVWNPPANISKNIIRSKVHPDLYAIHRIISFVYPKK